MQVNPEIDGLVVSTQHTGAAGAAIRQDAPKGPLTRLRNIPRYPKFSRVDPDACAPNVPSPVWDFAAGAGLGVALLVLAAAFLVAGSAGWLAP